MIRLALLLICLAPTLVWGQFSADDTAPLRQLQPAPDSLSEVYDGIRDDDSFTRQYASWAELAQCSRQEKAPFELVLILGKADRKRFQQPDWTSLRRVRNVRRLFVQLATPLTQPLADSLLHALADWPTLETVGVGVPDAGPYAVDASAAPIDGRLGARLKTIKQLSLTLGAKPTLDGLRLFGQCPSLSRLIISLPDDSTGRLPAEIARLRQVTAIDLLGTPSAATIEAVLAGFPSLTALSLSCPFRGTGLTRWLRHVPALRSLALHWRPAETDLTGLRVARLRRLESIRFDGAVSNGTLLPIGDILAGATSVRRVTVKGSALTSLDWLAALPRIEQIELAGGLRRLSARSLRHLTKLAVVRMGGDATGPQALPALTTLPNLTTLSLARTGLRRLPATIGNLRSLTALDLSGNQLQNVPDELGRLSKLTRLTVAGNGLTALPAALSGLTSLTYLDASENRLVKLPGLGRLTQLRHLAVAGNQLAQLPADLIQCRRLTYLNAGRNPLTNLPDALGQLDSLQHLFVGETRLNQLPPSIGQLRRLQEVEVGSDALARLPDELSACTQLSRLAVNGAGIVSLPDQLGALRQLTDLTLSCRALQRLPDDLGHLTALNRLAVFCPQLSQLPANLGNLAQLTDLRIYSDQLTSLPESMGRLTNLRRLTVSGSADPAKGQLGRLPASLTGCVGLREVAIEQQRAFDGAAALNTLARLPLLYRLTMDNAGIDTLVGVDWKAVGLRSLFLPNNRLRDLPEAMLELPNLWGLNLYHNPLPPGLATTFGSTAELRIALLATRLTTLPTDKPDPTVMWAYMQAAYQHMGAGNEGAALAALTTAIQVAPDSLQAFAYVRRGGFNKHRNASALAAADFERAIALSPVAGAVPVEVRAYGWTKPAQLRAQYWLEVGLARDALGQWEQAIDAIEQGLRLLPAAGDEYERLQRIDLYEAQANVYAHGNKPAGVRGCLQSAYRLSTSLNRLPRERLVEVQYALLCGQPEQAERSLAQFRRTAARMETGSGEMTVAAYLALCRNLLLGKQTLPQARAAMLRYLHEQPETFFDSSFTLMNSLLPHAGLPRDKVIPMLALTKLVKQHTYDATEKWGPMVKPSVK